MYITVRICLVGVKTRRMKNRENKIGRNMSFSTVWFKRETENGEENFPSDPHFFILPNWEEIGEKKVLTNVLLFISPTPHFIHLI